MRRGPHNVTGFTLIELMLVVCVIGLLAAIAIPKFQSTLTSAQAATTRGNLGVIRSALSIYYGDTEGQFPVDNLTSLTQNGKYLSAIPKATYPRVPGRCAGHVVHATVFNSFIVALFPDAGGWFYQNIPVGAPSSLDPTYLIPWGVITPNCTHQDPQGTFWWAVEYNNANR